MSRWAFWVSAIGILVLSLAPPSITLPTTGWDKSNHLLGFAVLASLAHSAWPARTMMVLVSLLAYGALIELSQSFTPDRYPEWNDLWADCTGLLIGQILMRLKQRLRHSTIR